MAIIHPLLGFLIGTGLSQLLIRCARRDKQLVFYDIQIKSAQQQRRFIRYTTAVLSALMAGLFWFNAQSFAGSSHLLFMQIMTCILISAAAFDVAFRLIPLQIIALLVATSLLGPGIWSIPQAIGPALQGGLIVGGIVFALYLFTKGRGIGEADIILAFIIGLLFGWLQGLIVFSAANFLGLLVMLPLIARFGKNRTQHIPLVFFLVLAVFLEWYLLYSETILQWMGL